VDTFEKFAGVLPHNLRLGHHPTLRSHIWHVTNKQYMTAGYCLAIADPYGNSSLPLSSANVDLSYRIAKLNVCLGRLKRYMRKAVRSTEVWTCA
jgi:hypothetical protein